MNEKTRKKFEREFWKMNGIKLLTENTANIRKQRGITLIALIVTIIVLLILAGVSLNLVAGSDGIINKASNAVSETKKATIKEEVELLIAELQMNYYEDYANNKTNYPTALDYAKAELQEGDKKTGSGVTITYTAPKYYYERTEFTIDTNGNVTVGDQTGNAGGATNPAPESSPSVTTTPEQKYTIIYNANGGETTPDSATNLVSGSIITLPTLTREGYNFLGWAIDPSSTTADYEGAYTVTGDVTLYAVWEKSTLANLGISNSNIGDYIDLQNDPLGTGNSATNWRVFYVDGSNVYAILADYLPNSTGYAASAGLDTSGDYAVYSNATTGSRDILLNGLTTTANWANLGNGYSTNVTGTPTYDQLKNSWNNNSKMTSKLLDELIAQNNLSDSTKLYIPHVEDFGSCIGYWLATPLVNDINDIWRVDYREYIDTNRYYLENGICAIRPVVCLSSNTLSTSTTTDGITTWTLSK